MSKPTLEDIMWMVFTKGNGSFGDFLTLMRFNDGFFDGRDKVIVELGTYLGMGAIILASRGAKVFTIDRYDRFDYEIIQKYLALWNITAIKNDTADEADNWTAESVNVLFVDGCHDHEGVRRDYRAWINKVMVGGVIIFHDIDPDHSGTWDFYNDDIQDEIMDGRLREIICDETQHGHSSVIKVFVRNK